MRRKRWSTDKTNKITRQNGRKDMMLSLDKENNWGCSKLLSIIFFQGRDREIFVREKVLLKISKIAITLKIL